MSDRTDIINDVLKIFDTIIKNLKIEGKNNCHVITADKTVDFMFDIDKYKRIRKSFQDQERLHLLLGWTELVSGTEVDTSSMMQIIKFAENCVTQKIPYRIQLQRCLDRFKQVTAPPSVVAHKFNMCCGTTMTYITQTELICEICNRALSDVENVVDEEKQKYVSSRHCEEWLTQIQAKEKINKGCLEDNLNRIETMLISWDVIPKHRQNTSTPLFIPTKSIRECLKRLKLSSQLNDHVCYIRKRLTGYIPEQLTEFEESIIVARFTMVEAAYESIELDEKTQNTPYYPYFIYKIFEIELESAPRKLNSLLECIHIQDDETLFKLDQIWKKICEIIPDYQDKYRRTDKYRQFY